LKQVAKATGKTPKRLEGDDYPEAGLFLWNTFWMLNTSRTADAGIPYSEIAAYAHLMNIEFSPWDVDVIRAMDLAYSQAINDRQSK